MSTPGAEEARTLSSNAWQKRRGLFGGYAPGMLLASGERVSFVTKDGPVFEADRAEIAVDWPWHQFGGAVNLTVHGQTYRLSLIRPKGAPQFDPTPREYRPDAGRDWVSEFVIRDGRAIPEDFAAIRDGRGSGRNWKAYFGANGRPR